MIGLTQRALKPPVRPADFCSMKQLILALVLALGPAAALAQYEESPIALETGIGFTSDPTTFLLATELPIRIARDWDLGPLVQLGVGDNRLIVAPTLNVRYSFPLSRYVTDESPVWQRLRPLAHAGLGFAYIERDQRFAHDDDLGFMFNLGLGIHYDWTDRVSFGTRMTFNVMPGQILDDSFFFSWQLAQLRYRF